MFAEACQLSPWNGIWRRCVRGRLGSGSKLPQRDTWSRVRSRGTAMAECVLLLWRCWGWLGQIILSEALGRKQRNVGLASSPPSILTQQMEGQALGQQPVTQTSALWCSHAWGCIALCLALGCFQQRNKQGSTTRSSWSVLKQQESYLNLRLGRKMKSSNTHVMVDSQWRAQMRAQKAFSENTHQWCALHFWKWALTDIAEKSSPGGSNCNPG